VLPWDRDGSKDGVERLRVGLGVSALPRAGCRKPPRLNAGGIEPRGQRLAVIRGAERHRHLLATKPFDGLEAPLHGGIGVRTFDRAEALDELARVSRAEYWPPGPHRLRETGIALARAAVDRCKIGSNGLAGQVELPPPMVVVDRWFGDSKLMQHRRDAHQGTLLVEGKASYGFTLVKGRQLKGHDLIEGKGWCWHQHPWEAGVRYVRLRATNPTSGQVTVVIVDEPGQDRFYLVCLETERSAPQLIRR
jgi:hypothetical protein